MFINSITQKIRTSYRHKLSCIFSIGILIPLLIIFATGIVYLTHQSVQIVNDKTKIEENSVTKKLDDAFNNIYNKMFYLINLDIIHEVLHTDKALTISEQLDINEKMNIIDIFFPLDSSQKLTIYTTNPNISNPKYIKKVTSDEIDRMFDKDDMNLKIEHKDGFFCISLYKHYSAFYEKYNHALSISVPVSNVFSNNNYSYDNGFFLYYSNGGDEIIDITVPDKENTPDVKKYIKNGRLRNFTVREINIPYIDGSFYIFKNVKAENTKIAVTIMLFIIIFLMLTIFVIFLISILSKTLTNKLTSIISEIELDEIKAPTPEKNNNEFYIIHNKLYDLTCNLKKENEKILKIEMELLNQKISPHFLYNNLSAIKWNYNDEKLDNIIDLLTTYYRNIFQKKGAFIKLGEEINNLEIYISLLKFAYEQDFSYTVEEAGEINNSTILSNILQPLVENAFLHSINSTDEKTSFIKIKTYCEEDTLYLKVINNHCNEDIERINEIANNEYKGKSALPIIQKRIHLYYGESFGLSFSKKEDVLTACVRLPVLN